MFANCTPMELSPSSQSVKLPPNKVSAGARGTGSDRPGFVSRDLPLWTMPGDLCEVEIEQIGLLRNPTVVA